MNNKLTVMTSVIISMLVASMDTTIANTTMPVIVKEIGGEALYAWAFTAYMIVSTILSPIAGRLSDLFGRKRIFAAGIVLFLGGSLLCGLSQSMVQLVLFRGLQGVGAGVLMPFPAIIAGDLYSVEQRGKIQAFFTAMWGLSAVLAPLLGSLFVTYLSWRWIFYVNVPLCLLALVTLKPYREVYTPKRAAVDVTGALLFGAGISLLLLVTVVQRYAFVYGAVGVLLLTVFVLYERKLSSPLMPLPLFKQRSIALMLAGSFTSFAAMFGTSSYIPLFLQHEGFSLFVSGVALLGMSFGWMAAAVPAGKWVLRYGYKPLLAAGHLFVLASAGMLFMLGEGASFAYVFTAMIVQGLAFGLISTVSTIGSQQLVAAHEKGISTSLQVFARNIGTAIGVTVMGAFLTHGADFYGGVHALFAYGLAVSAASALIPWGIRREERGEAAQ